MEGSRATKENLQKELAEVQKEIRGWRKTKKFAKSINHQNLLLMARNELREQRGVEQELADLLWVKLGAGGDSDWEIFIILYYVNSFFYKSPAPLF